MKHRSIECFKQWNLKKSELNETPLLFYSFFLMQCGVRCGPQVRVLPVPGGAHLPPLPQPHRLHLHGVQGGAQSIS